MPSNFTTPDRAGVSWALTDGATVWTCSISGNGFIRLLQQTLGGMISSPTLTYDRSRVTGSDITEDARWGAITQKGLWIAATAAGLPAELTAGVAAESRSRTIGPSSLAAAVFIVARAYRPITSDLTLAHLLFDARAAVPPTWIVAPPVAPGDQPLSPVCSASAPAEPLPPVAQTVPTPAPPPAVEPTPTPEEAAVPHAVAPVGNNPASVVPRSAVVSTVPLGAIAAVVAGVLIVGGIGLMISRKGKSKAPRANPRRVRRAKGRR